MCNKQASLTVKIRKGRKKVLCRLFHRFRQATFPDGGLVLGLSKFSVLPQLPPKTMLSLKEVKINSKISNSLC